MSKEQKTLKSCYILDRLREWFELYGNQNHQRAEEELHLAIDELYEYQQKDQRIADLEAKLAESEKQRQHLKDWLDNEILTSVDNESYYATINEYEEEVKQLKQQLHELPKKIVEEIKDKIPEIGGMKCEIIIDDSLTLNILLGTILNKYRGEDE